MKFIGNILYLTVPELVAVGIPEGTIIPGVSKGLACWQGIKNPDKLTELFIQYETLKPSHKESIKAKYGDPYIYAQNTIKECVIDDPADFTYYQTKGIPEKTIYHYQRQAAWFRFLTIADHKKHGFKDKETFYKACFKLIAVEEIPKFKVNNVRVLQRNLKSFKEQGLDYIIHGNTGNKAAEKLGEIQKNWLRQTYSDPRKFPISMIWVLYMAEARKFGWEQVTEMCIYTYLKQHDVQQQCTALRHGLSAWKNKYDPIVNRQTPSYPNDMWVGDGTPLELYYREGNNFNKRFYVYMWVDAATRYIVGYSVGETETGQMVADALKMACCNHNTVPHQLQFDNSSANKSVLNIINKVSKIAFAPEVGNARAKVIESINAHFNRTILKFFHNHSGGNITAKSQDTHANREFLQKFKKEVIPEKAEALQMLHMSIKMWNSLNKNDKKTALPIPESSPAQNYSITSPRHLPLSDTLRLSAFGIQRKDSIQYTNEGIRMVVNGNKEFYWVDDQDFYYKSVGRSFDIKYDPANLNSIALYEKDTLIAIAQSKNIIPMARVDFKEGDQANLNKLLNFKKDVKKDVIERSRIDAEGYRKAAISVNGVFKDSLNAAEGNIKEVQMAESVITDEALFGLYDEQLTIGTIYGSETK